MKTSGIVTLTMNPALDKSCAVGRVVPGRKLRCQAPRFDAGGGGINVARALERLGGRATALFLAGGRSGERLTHLLEQEGVPNRPIRISQETRENLTVIETETGQQFRFGMPGPTLVPEDCESVLAALSEQDPPPQFLVVSGSLPAGVPDDFYGRVVEFGNKRGTKVIVDSHGEPLRHAVAAHPFLIKPNLRELGELSRGELENDEQIEAAARTLAEGPKCDICLVSLGAAGALWVSADGMYRLRAPTVPIRSKVGAGDCTVAGLVLALARGWPAKQALALAVAAGAAAVMTPGTELCRRADAERLYAILLAEEVNEGQEKAEAIAVGIRPV